MPETTGRGFRIYTTFHDRYGQRVRVQESSLATEPAVWIFCDFGSPGFEVPRSPHLTVDQARMLRAGLDRFIAEATDA